MIHLINVKENIMNLKQRMYKGKIINEIPIDSKKIILYNDNTFKIYEGEMNNGYYNGNGIEYCPLVKDLVLFDGYFSNNYYISPNAKSPNNICQILVLTKGDQAGKSLLIAKISNTKYDNVTTNFDMKIFDYEYNEREYKTMIFDTATSERYNYINNGYIKRADIIIYMIDLYKESLIEDYFVKGIKRKKEDVLIYIVGNKLDKVEEKDITKQCLEKFRNQASELIEQKLINKCFETSCKTGEGVDNLIRHLKIDSSIIIDKRFQKFNNPNNKLRDKFDKIKEIDKIFKYLKY